MTNSNELTSQLETRLHAVEEEFDREMRIRGFDPDQADNVALPGPLAKLYAEREYLREKLVSDAGALDE